MKTTTLLLPFLLAGVFCLALTQRADAQWWYGAATYQIAFPSGDTKDFANNTSFRGVGLDFRKAFNDNSTWGISLGWNVFHERINETIELKTDNPGAVTGLQDRTVNSFPIMLNAHWYFGRERDIRPYIGLNAGGFIMLQRFEIGIRSLQEDRWEWGGAPEAGVVVPVQDNFTLLLSGKFNYAFTGKSVTGSDINHSYFSLNIGFAWEQ